MAPPMHAQGPHAQAVQSQGAHAPGISRAACARPAAPCAGGLRAGRAAFRPAAASAIRRLPEPVQPAGPRRAECAVERRARHRRGLRHAVGKRVCRRRQRRLRRARVDARRAARRRLFGEHLATQGAAHPAPPATYGAGRSLPDPFASTFGQPSEAEAPGAAAKPAAAEAPQRDGGDPLARALAARAALANINQHVVPLTPAEAANKGLGRKAPPRDESRELPAESFMFNPVQAEAPVPFIHRARSVDAARSAAEPRRSRPAKTSRPWPPRPPRPRPNATRRCSRA